MAGDAPWRSIDNLRNASIMLAVYDVANFRRRRGNLIVVAITEMTVGCVAHRLEAALAPSGRE